VPSGPGAAPASSRDRRSSGSWRLRRASGRHRLELPAGSADDPWLVTAEGVRVRTLTDEWQRGQTAQNPKNGGYPPKSARKSARGPQRDPRARGAALRVRS
jgi:hypothetical protein